MRIAGKIGTALTVALFSVAMIAGNVCACDEIALATSSAQGHHNGSPAHPCQEATTHESHCPSHSFHVGSSSVRLIGSSQIDSISTLHRLGESAANVLSPIVFTFLAAPVHRFHDQSNPVRAARSLIILNATFLL